MDEITGSQLEALLPVLINKYGRLQISSAELYKYKDVNAECFDCYMHMERTIETATKLRKRNIKERQLEVMYITGKSGSGKTTAAKYIANHFHYDYFVSGSGDDVMDGYDFEECIILDDFRAQTFRFSELLKFLDNNTESSVKSRYFNKSIGNCKLLIITSVVEPQDVYSFFKNSEEDMDEPMEQLFRRLKHRFYKIEDNGDLREYSLIVDQEPTPTDYIIGNMTEIYEALGINPKLTDNHSLLDSIKTAKPLKKLSDEELRKYV